MSRQPSSASLTLAQLERLMRTRRTEMARLGRQRDKLQKKLDAMNARIAAVSGGSVGNGRAQGGGRGRNAVSLQDVIHQILSKAGGPMGVGDIAAKVLASGYQTKSGNFRGIVNQTLIKDKKGFSKAGRGLYQIKK